ncbi:MAG TPA: Rieske (2Fe-2S) protein [Caulobacteraceae bacterium]|nr:Rieske (2Fe-2S) protein [Caulobacteraceae bacterium]
MSFDRAQNPGQNPAQPGAGETLCPLAELADPGAKGFHYRVGDAIFAGFIVRQGERVHGYVDSCPHAGWPLSSGGDRFLTREGDRILCAGHGAVFRIDDGAVLFGPCDRGLTPWPVEVGSDGMVRTS